MTRSIARWTTAIAAVAVLAMPATGLAQTQPPTTTDPGQTMTRPSGASEQAAKQHLTAARNTLSELTQLPAAAQLTGEARTQVSQLISNFNEMITTDTQWRASYAKLEANLNALIGPRVSTDEPPTPPATGTPGAVGTSGIVDLDPEIRSKLTEFRNHLEQFEQAAGGAQDQPGTTTHPMTHPSTTGHTTTGQTTHPAQAEQPHHETAQMDREELLRHIDAIEAILGVQAAASRTPGTPGAPTTDPRSTTPPTTTPPTTTPGAVGTTGTVPSVVTLDQAQLQQLRQHLSELRRLVNK